MEIALIVSILLNCLFIYLLAINIKKVEELEEYSENITDTLIEIKSYVDESSDELLKSDLELASFETDLHLGIIIKTFKKLKSKLYNLLDDIKSTP